MNNERWIKLGRYFLSFMFVFGALSKLLSMPFFDNMVAELFLGKSYYEHPKSMYALQWMSRILVALELGLGLALLQNKYFKKRILPASIAVLFLFTIHLFYDGFSKPNGFIDGNCGCFGDILPMTNLESIIKNIVGLLVGFILWKKFNNTQKISGLAASIFLGLVALFTLSFGVKKYELSPDFLKPSFLEKDSADLKDSDTMVTFEYAPADTSNKKNEVKKDVKPPVERVLPTAPVLVSLPKTLENMIGFVPLLKDKFTKDQPILICLFSMSCGHCQEVYKEICEAKSSQKMPSVYLLNYGSEYEQNYFFNQSGGCKDPHSRFENIVDFKRMLEGKSYPRLLHVKNGKVLKEWDIDTYEHKRFLSYFGIELEEKKGGLEFKKEEDPFSPW